MFKIPKNAIMTINVKGNVLKGSITFPDKDVLELDTVDSVNTVLRNIYEKESVQLSDLLRSGRVVIASDKVWDKFTVTGKGIFVKSPVVSRTTGTRTITPAEAPTVTPVVTPTAEAPTVAPVVTPTAEAPTVAPVVTSTPTAAPVVAASDGAIDVTDSTTDTRSTDTKPIKKEIRNLKIANAGKKLFLIGLGAAGIIYILSGGLNNLFSNKSNGNSLPNNNDNNNDNNDYTPAIEQQVDAQAEVTYNMPSDEEVIVGYSNPSPSYSYGMYDYTEVGSVVTADSMELQLSEIDNLCASNDPHCFENLVIASDYDAIATISNMRNRVVNNSCAPAIFMDNVVAYIFEGNTYFDGKNIMPYDSLSPYAQFIVVRSAQNILIKDPSYIYRTSYNQEFPSDALINSFNFTGSDLYDKLIHASSKTM